MKRLSLLVFALTISTITSVAASELQDVYGAVSSSCGYSENLGSLYRETWELAQKGDVVRAQSNLQTLDASGFEYACEKSTYALISALLSEKSENYIDAIDTLEGALQSELIPPEFEQKIQLRIAKNKVQAEASGEKLKRKYRPSKKEELAVNWDSFVRGAFRFKELKSSGFLSKLASSFVLMAKNEIQQVENYVAGGEWEELAKYVMTYRKKGLDVDYYYLALAANGLGLKEQAEIYSKKSIEVNQRDPLRHCKRYKLSDGSRDYSYCAKHSMPKDATNLLAYLERQKSEQARKAAEARAEEKRRIAAAEEKRKAELARKQREAEEKANRQARADSLNAKYPPEWVEAILSRQVVKGMSKEAVMEAKGPPERTEVLGDSEMWTYGSQNIIFTGNTVSFVSR